MMRRVGIKRTSSCDVSSWDPPPAKKARVEIRQRSGFKLWSKITSTFSGVLSFVRGWFHSPHRAAPHCTPPMSNEHPPPSPTSPPSPTLSSSTSPPPGRSSPPTVSEENSSSLTTCPVTSHPCHPTDHKYHLPPPPSSPPAPGNSQRQAVANKKNIRNEAQDKHRRSHLGWSRERPSSVPHAPSTCSPPSLKTSLSTLLKGSCPENLGPQHVFTGHHHTPSHLHTVTPHTSPSQGKSFPDITHSTTTLPSQWTTPLPIHTLTTVPPHSSPLSSPHALAHPPSHTRHSSATPSLTTHHKNEVLRQRQWVEAMRADHLHSLHQHREAVERELQHLQECRESRFLAEDSRVKRLQESVRNMSLIGEKGEEEEEEEEELSLVLSKEQEQKVHHAVAAGLPAEVLSTRFNISITRADISRLTGHNWLNDEIINFYLSLVAERSQLGEGRCKVHTMSSFFYPKLRADGYSGVRRWTRKVDIFAHDMVLYPIHLGAHWCLAAVDFRHRQFHYYDSLLCSNGSCLSLLRDYLVAEARNKKGEELSLQDWTNIVPKDIPMQMNSSDCGVFTCMYARYLASSAPFTFSQEDMPDIRKHMICEILEQRLF